MNRHHSVSSTFDPNTMQYIFKDLETGQIIHENSLTNSVEIVNEDYPNNTSLQSISSSQQSVNKTQSIESGIKQMCTFQIGSEQLLIFFRAKFSRNNMV